MVDKLFLSAVSPFGSMEEEEDHFYQTMLGNHLQGEAIVISLQFILQRRIEKADVPWTDLHFDSKAQSH